MHLQVNPLWPYVLSDAWLLEKRFRLRGPAVLAEAPSMLQRRPISRASIPEAPAKRPQIPEMGKREMAFQSSQGSIFWLQLAPPPTHTHSLSSPDSC